MLFLLLQTVCSQPPVFLAQVQVVLQFLPWLPEATSTQRTGMLSAPHHASPAHAPELEHCVLFSTTVTASLLRTIPTWLMSASAVPAKMALKEKAQNGGTCHFPPFKYSHQDGLHATHVSLLQWPGVRGEGFVGPGMYSWSLFIGSTW